MGTFPSQPIFEQESICHVTQCDISIQLWGAHLTQRRAQRLTMRNQKMITVNNYWGDILLDGNPLLSLLHTYTFLFSSAVWYLFSLLPEMHFYASWELHIDWPLSKYTLWQSCSEIHEYLLVLGLHTKQGTTMRTFWPRRENSKPFFAQSPTRSTAPFVFIFYVGVT